MITNEEKEIPFTKSDDYLLEGWLIESTPSGQRSDRNGPAARYLQIGTGQWCDRQYATLFPEISTAKIYAKEYGYDLGQQVRIVRHRKY